MSALGDEMARPLTREQPQPLRIAASGEPVYTSGQVAKILAVSSRTVNTWCNRGDLDHYRLPGSKDRRITKSALRAFVEAHGLPDELVRDPKSRRAVCVGVIPDELKNALIDQGFDVEPREGLFGAGLSFGEGAPSCVVVDLGIGRLDARIIAAKASVAGVVAVALASGGRAEDADNFRQTYTTREPQAAVALAITRMVEAAERDRAKGGDT